MGYKKRHIYIKIMNQLAATAIAVLVPASASAMIVIAITVIMITAIDISAGIAAGDFILWASDYETGSPIVVHIINYGLTEQFGILRAHVDLHTPALKDFVPSLFISQSQTIIRAGGINRCQEHPDHFALYLTALDHIGCRLCNLYHELHIQIISSQTRI
jgi:hypothetical protein